MKRIITPHVFEKIILFFCLTIFSALLLLPSPFLPSFLRENTLYTHLFNKDKNVLSANYRPPMIYVSGGDYAYKAGGMISLSSQDEPAIYIGTYNIEGTAEVSIYQASEDMLLTYLLHDEEGKQTQANVDTSSLTFVAKATGKVSQNSRDPEKILLPLTDSGVWYLSIKVGSETVSSFVTRSSIGIVAKEGDNQLLLWGQDLKTRRSITDGTITIYDLEGQKREVGSGVFNNEGIGTAPLLTEGDIALIRHGGDIAIVPLNLQYLNYSYSYDQFTPKKNLVRYFIFTDRPIYEPGDKVYFKSVLRNDDDARLSIPGGSVRVRIFDNYFYEGREDVEPLFDSVLPISEEGTVNGEYVIPKDAKVGEYTVFLSTPSQNNTRNYWNDEWASSSTYFSVQFFQKPEYTIDVTSDKTELIKGESSSFTISGKYFSGEPLKGKTITYSVTAADFWEYNFLNDQLSYGRTISDEYRYGYYSDNTHKVVGKTVTLDGNGEATIPFSTKGNFNKGKNQVFMLEATVQDKSSEPAFSRKNVLVLAGEFGIFRQNASYSSQVGQRYTLPLTLSPNDPSFEVDNITLSSTIKWENWIAIQNSNKKSYSYRKEEEALQPLKAVTDAKGNATFSFIPQKVGSYTFEVTGKDKRGNSVIKTFYTYVSKDDIPYYRQNEDAELRIVPDKSVYLPSDTLQLDIYSTIPDRDIYLTLERARVNRQQVVKMSGKKARVSIPLVETDMPNMYITASSFSHFELNSAQENIKVSAEQKRINVELVPDSKKYKPGDTVSLTVKTTAENNQPVSAELAVWSVDKAIFELIDSNLGDIFETFWQERYHSTKSAHSLQGIFVLQAEQGGGCFVKGTKVLMGDGTEKNIEDVKVGDYVLTRSASSPELVKARVSSLHHVKEDGYMIINSSLKVTPNHKLFINGFFEEAGSIQVGDRLVDKEGRVVPVTSVEYIKHVADVYNFEVETYHTYFAGGVFVHNQKGGSRTVFKDTAYWNPSVRTNAQGVATVTYKLPDNVTTWTIAAVAATTDTKVGQSTEEIVVSKNVIVRPVLPSILRVGDEMILSTVVHNNTDEKQMFNVSLNFDAGSVLTPTYENVSINANELKQLTFKVKPTKINDKAKIIVSAVSVDQKDLGDTITSRINVQPFYFVEKRAENKTDNASYAIKFSADTDLKRSKVTLSLAPSIFGMLPQAMYYLLEYPYGCVEQVTSRLAPALLAKLHPDFNLIVINSEVDEIIDKGISRLRSLQNQDGGWSWFGSSTSDPFITAYVVERLLEKEAIDTTYYSETENALNRAENFFKNYKTKSKEQLIARAYGLAITDRSKENAFPLIKDLDQLTPDFHAIGVMTNQLYGYVDSKTNGLDSLVRRAKSQGDSIFFEAGAREYFGSIDASTALAIRAMSTDQDFKEMEQKAVRYLARNRAGYYWTNSYATAQVLTALATSTVLSGEQNPDYGYTAQVAGKTILRGRFTNTLDKDASIAVSSDLLSKDGTQIEVEKQGTGNLYSSLIVSEYRTDRKAKALDHGLKVTREYVNEKGDEYSLGVGDTAIVKITVDGLSSDDRYAVIDDILPAGLVAINQDFKNQQYESENQTYDYNVYEEVKEDGMVLNISSIKKGLNVFTYRARVVSEGTYAAPPVTASLMYSPEIYGRSDAQTITVDKEAKLLPGRAAKGIFASKNIVIILSVLLVITVLTGYIVSHARKKGIQLSVTNLSRFAKTPQEKESDTGEEKKEEAVPLQEKQT